MALHNSRIYCTMKIYGFSRLLKFRLQLLYSFVSFVIKLSSKRAICSLAKSKSWFFALKYLVFISKYSGFEYTNKAVRFVFLISKYC